MTTRRGFKGSLYEGGLPLTAPVLLISMLAGYEAFSRTVEASIRGKDYPEGHLTRPDPVPIRWNDADSPYRQFNLPALDKN